MKMSDNSPYSSVKMLCYLIGLIIFLSTTQLGAVDSRALRPTRVNISNGANRDEGIEFRVSSSIKTKGGGLPLRKMESAFTLASGPSKRGPGH
ncbi:unnamed protein product [Lactuca virosa]|uniref:Uncharacterized protein n=1 Tax=Lactuca virosa TaxID=75947 RepID=A0AAU9PWL5_9ASTR|nr:unnamed protein product [Lactuca virosa]